MERLIRKEGGEGPLSDKLRRAQAVLANSGAESAEERLQILVKVLSEVGLTEEEAATNRFPRSAFTSITIRESA